MALGTGEMTAKKSHLPAPGTTIAFDVLCTPGAYVCDWSGHLLRVTEQALVEGRAPALNIVGTQPLTLTKISNDPQIALSQAKRIAHEYHLNINF
jgi:hypothetical protein